MTLVVDQGSGPIKLYNHGKIGLGGPSSRRWMGVEKVSEEWSETYTKPKTVRIDSEGCHRSEDARLEFTKEHRFGHPPRRSPLAQRQS
jgi:hypothetical protein